MNQDNCHYYEVAARFSDFGKTYVYKMKSSDTYIKNDFDFGEAVGYTPTGSAFIVSLIPIDEDEYEKSSRKQISLSPGTSNKFANKISCQNRKDMTMKNHDTRISKAESAVKTAEANLARAQCALADAKTDKLISQVDMLLANKKRIDELVDMRNKVIDLYGDDSEKIVAELSELIGQLTQTISKVN